MWAKYVPIHLCSAKLAKNNLPLLLCKTKLAQKQAFTQRSFYTETFLYIMAAEIAAPKPGSTKNTILKHLSEGILKENHQRQN